MAYSKPAWHLYAIRIDFEELGIDRQQVMASLKKDGILTQVHYIPVHTQPYYKDLYGEIDLPGAQEYYQKTLTLPLYPAMSDSDVGHVFNSVKKAVNQKHAQKI